MLSPWNTRLFSGVSLQVNTAGQVYAVIPTVYQRHHNRFVQCQQVVDMVKEVRREICEESHARDD